MSEKKGPFDAAINCLTVMADRDFANGAPHRGVFRAAIAVLEAAGKVTADDIAWLRGKVEASTEYMPLPGHVCPGRARKDRFRALLEALPDDGGKE